MTRRRFTRAMILFTVLVIAALAGVYFGGRWLFREQHAMRCRSNLATLAKAIDDYELKNGRMPPAYVKGPDGKPWHSWRVLILPYLGRQDLHDAYRFDEPWNGPNNSKLIDQMPEVFGCPAEWLRGSGKTNYFAIVGSQSAWPGDRAPTTEELLVGDYRATTLLLIESSESSVVWSEPRDITVAEMFPIDEESIGPPFSSNHSDAVNAAFFYGYVKRLKKDDFRGLEGRKKLYGMMTAWSGRPHNGQWLPGELDLSIGKFPPEVGDEKLTATDVVGHLHGRATPKRNAIWCATMQIAWDELRQKIGEAPLIKDSELADGMSKSSFPRTALDPASYVARSGRVAEGIAAKIDEEMNRKFPGVPDRPGTSAQPSHFTIFCFLQKNLPFAVRFDKLPDPLIFHAPSGDINVKSFGFKTLTEAKGSQYQLKEQTGVLHYRSDDEFVIRLTTKTDEIVLAKVAPVATLTETVANVKKRIAEGEKARPKIEDDETLIVPKLAFNVLRNYRELRGKIVHNFKGDDANHLIEEAKQSVRFLLNESGARIESGTEIQLPEGNGHEPPPPPKPRRFILDKPFLLYVKEAKAEEPYLVVWVANGEIMESANN